MFLRGISKRTAITKGLLPGEWNTEGPHIEGAVAFRCPGNGFAKSISLVLRDSFLAAHTCRESQTYKCKRSACQDNFYVEILCQGFSVTSVKPLQLTGKKIAIPRDLDCHFGTGN